MTKKEPLNIALIQTASGADVDANVAEVRARLHELAGRADIALMPENVFVLGKHQTVRNAARELRDWHETLAELAATFQGTVVFGGVPIREKDKIYNSSLAMDEGGHVISRYDKMHLFQLHLPEKVSIDETRLYAGGEQPVSFIFKGWKIALSICYDLRFPELYRSLVPFDILVCTAAFTFRTGTAHWELLLRARAVENLCFAVGVGQCGINPDNEVPLFGHSLAVAPRGEVLKDLGSEPGTAVISLDPGQIRDARTSLPALEQRRLRC